jgi:hypothetical protein
VDSEADRAGGVEEARVICKEGVGANSERSGEEAGRAITFASDAHTTDALAGNFYEAHGNGRAPRPSPSGLLDPLTVLRWRVGLPNPGVLWSSLRQPIYSTKVRPRRWDVRTPRFPLILEGVWGQYAGHRGGS